VEEESETLSLESIEIVEKFLFGCFRFRTLIYYETSTISFS